MNQIFSPLFEKLRGNISICLVKISEGNEELKLNRMSCMSWNSYRQKDVEITWEMDKSQTNHIVNVVIRVTSGKQFYFWCATQMFSELFSSFQNLFLSKLSKTFLNSSLLQLLKTFWKDLNWMPCLKQISGKQFHFWCARQMFSKPFPTSKGGLVSFYKTAKSSGQGEKSVWMYSGTQWTD